jgi:hypothetical protein
MTSLFGLSQECWDDILSFVDIKTCGRLYGCHRDMDLLARPFWQRRCLQYYGDHCGEREEAPRLLAKRALCLQLYARTKHRELESHWCYPACATVNGAAPVDVIRGEDFFPDAAKFDFYVRLRLENGQQLSEQFYPAGSVRIEENELAFPIDRPNWPGLQIAQHYYNQDDHPRRDAGNILEAAWECTSALIVGMKGGQISPVVVAAGFSFPKYFEGGRMMHLTMDFDSCLPRCINEGDRFWQFLHLESNDETGGIDYELGFVASIKSLKWLVLLRPQDESL